MKPLPLPVLPRPVWALPIFALAALSPLAVLALAIGWGGVWVWLALAWLAGAVLSLDLALPLVAAEGEDFAGSDLLLAGLGLGALGLLPWAVWAVAGPSGLTAAERAGLFVAASLWFGQVAHPAAHELIHRPGRALHGLGVAVYTALMFGHHASAHPLVHHRHVASGLDPNTARAGEGFYRFLGRAWLGSLRAGYRAESALRQARGEAGAGKAGAAAGDLGVGDLGMGDLGARQGPRPGGARGWRARRGHPYRLYGAGAAIGLGCGLGLAGAAGLAVWALFGVWFGAQVLLSDYVQHYGLTRRVAEGRPEPVGEAHSWNAPHVFSGALMLNAPRHSDHHAHPGRPYASLRLNPQMPMLPWPLPLACALALCPPYWHRRMRPLLKARLAKA